MNPLRIGTRGSKLALVQANMVADLLRAKGAARCTSGFAGSADLDLSIIAEDRRPRMRRPSGAPEE